MKLDENNKYNQKKAMGLSAIIMSGIILCGCSNQKGNGNEKEPVEIVTSIPTIEPTVAPTMGSTVEIVETLAPTLEPTSIPTLEPELTYEEKMESLGVKNVNYSFQVATLDVIEYTINGEKKIMFCQSDAYLDEDNSALMFDVFTNQYTFKVKSPVPSSWRDANLKKIVPNNEKLEGAIVTNIYFIYFLKDNYLKENIELSDKSNKYLDVICPDELRDCLGNMTTMGDLAEFYYEIAGNERVVASDIVNDKVLTK